MYRGIVSVWSERGRYQWLLLVLHERETSLLGTHSKGARCLDRVALLARAMFRFRMHGGERWRSVPGLLLLLLMVSVSM